MDKIDVFVWVDGEDGAGAAMATRALRNKMKAEVGAWYMLGPKSERSERLAYDLGMKPLVRPERLADLPALAAANGASPLVLFWSGAAVLISEWQPVQSGTVRLWEGCPAAVFARDGLTAAVNDAPGWPEFQAASALARSPLPPNQVKVVGPGDFEKAVHSQGWPFGPSLVILEKPVPRR